MPFNLVHSKQLLERTPRSLRALLSELDPSWINLREHDAAWTIHEIVAHLVFAETAHWPARVRAAMSTHSPQTFAAFDQSAQRALVETNTIEQLLYTFEEQRRMNLDLMDALEIGDHDLMRTALHPSLGEVTLQNIVATWTAHDHAHLVQISRTFAKSFADSVGPWAQNMSLLRKS